MMFEGGMICVCGNIWWRFGTISAECNVCSKIVQMTDPVMVKHQRMNCPCGWSDYHMYMTEDQRLLVVCVACGTGQATGMKMLKEKNDEKENEEGS